MNPLATELNTILQESNVHLYEMLSRAGKELFFPKGILSQSAEAKEKAYRFNATIGMATEKGRTMYLPSIMNLIGGLEPEEALTYAPSFGIKPLREAWRESLFEKNPSLADKRISLPVVSHAITHGLSVLSDVWVDPGDVIVLPDKMWGNYNLIFGVRRGALIRRYPLFDTAGGFNLEAFAACVREAAAQRDKVVVILNFPNNPTGYTVNEEEARKICKVLQETAEEGKNVLVFTDDAYFGLFYDDACLK
ncbi:MAG: aminotransferase class I/II-fold pyridoxal phosphate-dependent enzyme, partial [Deltaproteobacteria bacterium]|nr:aminotransferase class I/II-fold pyridoxal phosphate-dependent enzyme [Deltaproteobacteria bacterium]